MVFIPDENIAILDKPTKSFIPDSPSSFNLKPTKSFIPDKPKISKEIYDTALKLVQNAVNGDMEFPKSPKEIYDTAFKLAQNAVTGGMAFPVENIKAGKKILEQIERPIAGLRAVSKEGLNKFWEGVKSPEKYPAGTFAEALVGSGMEPISAGTLGSLADIGYYFGMPEALGRIATAGKVKLLENTFKNINKALKVSGETRTGVVDIPKETLDTFAKNNDIGNVIGIYLKSKNVKFARDTGLLEFKPTVRGLPAIPEIKPTPSFVPDIIPRGAKPSIAQPGADLKREQGIVAPTAKGGEIMVYIGKQEGKPQGKYIYGAENKNYAKNFGEQISEQKISPQNTLDLTPLKEISISFDKLFKTLKDNGVEIDKSVIGDDDVYKPAWQWIRKYPSIADKIKTAGFDSIKQLETFTGKGKKELTYQVLDNKILSPKEGKVEEISVGLDILKKEPRISPLKGKKLSSVLSITDKPMKVPLGDVETTCPIPNEPAFWYKDQRIKLTYEQKQEVLAKQPTQKEVKIIPAPKGKLTILPRKEQLLKQIDKAIEKTPIEKNTNELITFQIDGGAKIFNSKEALTKFKEIIKKQPKEMSLIPTKKGLPRAQGMETFEKAYEKALEEGGKENIELAKENLEQARLMLGKQLPSEPKTPTGREGFIKVDMLNPAKWDSVRQFIEDDWIRVKRLIQEKGTIAVEANDPYEAEKRYWGRVDSRIREFKSDIETLDKDIVSTAKKLNIPDKLLNKEIDRFLIARHAPERNAQHGEKAAGITDKQAYEIRAEIAGKPYSKEVERIADKVQALNNKTLDVLLEGDVITKELYDKLRAMYKNHIPLNRVMSDEDDIVEVLTRRGLDVQGTGLKRAKGSELEVSDIITNVLTNYSSALSRAEKNILDNYTLRFVRENKHFDGLFEEIKPKAIGKTFDGKIILQQIKDPQVLPVREKDNQIYLRINDPQLAMALRGVNREKIPSYLEGVRLFTRTMSSLATMFNPEFAVPNLIRDTQEVVVYLASKAGLKTALKQPANIPYATKAITDYLRHKDTEGARLYRQMLMDGGSTGGLALSTREKVETDIANIRAINRSNPRKAVKILFDSIENWNKIFEDTSRLATYKTALGNGSSRNVAAVMAKDASVNFNKMGTGGPIINSLWMFSNPSIQGTAKMIRAMRNPKVLATVLTLLGGAVFLINKYNDEKDKDWYKKINKWDKLNGINIVTVSNEKKFDYVTISISWALKPIKVGFDAIYDVSKGETTPPEAIFNVLASMIESYNPIGGSDIISAITPTILDIPVDIARNRAWHGGKIRPDWNPSAPASIQYFDSLRKTLVGQKAIEFTRKLGDRGMEVSPADIVYTYNTLIGGAGRFVNKVFNTIVGTAQGKVEAREVPFTSRFYRSTPTEEIREFGKDYTDLKKKLQSQDKARFYLGQEAELAWDGMKQLPLENRKENYMSIRRTNPILADKIKEVAKEEQANLTYTDRLVKKLGVENGERSKYLWDKISEIKDADERKNFYLDLRKKNVITDEVARQIKIRARTK